jgi:hypothetical protein
VDLMGKIFVALIVCAFPRMCILVPVTGCLIGVLPAKISQFNLESFYFPYC